MKNVKNMGRLLVMASLIASPYMMQAQVNAAANPLSQSINAASGSIALNHTVVTTFELGNNGADPIPAGGATWNISFPQLVSVDQASLNLDGGEGILAPSWTIYGGVTYLTINVVGAGIPAKVFQGPKTKFTMTVNLTGVLLGGPILQTINNSFDAGISQNLNAGDDNAFGPITVVASLPVRITNFTGTKTGVQSFINWEYSSAVNFSYFELERSGDGIHFSNLYNKHYTPTNKAGTGLKFTETDTQPLNGDNYYRLKMTDQDGSFMYSKTLKLNFVVSATVSVYPNPAKDVVRITGADAGSNIMLYDLAGKVLQSVKASGSRVDEMNVTRYVKGQYIIKVTGGAVTTNVKMVKQ